MEVIVSFETGKKALRKPGPTRLTATPLSNRKQYPVAMGT